MALPNARLIDLTNKDHLIALIDEFERSENIERKKRAWKAYQCKSGNQKHFVEEELKLTYPDSHNKFRVGNINLTKKVNRKISKAYKKPPLRKLENDAETNRLNEIYKRDKFGRSFKEMDSIFNLHKEVVSWVSFVNPGERGNEEGFYLFNALAPYEYDLVKDDRTGEPIIFGLNYPDSNITGQIGFNDSVEQVSQDSQADTSAETKRWSLWSATQHVQIIVKRVKNDKTGARVEITILPILRNLENKNELGRLPIGYLSAELAIDWPVPPNLWEQSVEWNVSFSDLKTAASTQGHGQLVIKHPEGKVPKKKHMGMHTSLNLPLPKNRDDPQPEADYINASPDLSGQLEVLKFDGLQILDDHGIKAGSTSINGGIEKFESGFDRVIANADVQDIIEDNQDLYGEITEQDVYQIVQAHQAAIEKDQFKSKFIEVKYEKPKVLISDKETLDNIEQQDEIGLLLEHEKFMIMNPNLTEQQAKDKLALVKAEKVKRMAEMAASLIPPEGENTGHEDESQAGDGEIN